jgi:hypothetical protein
MRRPELSHQMPKRPTTIGRFTLEQAHGISHLGRTQTSSVAVQTRSQVIDKTRELLQPGLDGIEAQSLPGTHKHLPNVDSILILCYHPSTRGEGVQLVLKRPVNDNMRWANRTHLGNGKPLDKVTNLSGAQWDVSVVIPQQSSQLQMGIEEHSLHAAGHGRRKERRKQI